MGAFPTNFWSGPISGPVCGGQSGAQSGAQSEAVCGGQSGRIKSIEGNILKGKTIKTKSFWMEVEEECTWDKIGVFLFDGESENEFTIEKKRSLW